MRKDYRVMVQIPARPPVDPLALLKRHNSYDGEDLLRFLSLGEQNQESASTFQIHRKVLEANHV